jgi:hypothetical protein
MYWYLEFRLRWVSLKRSAEKLCSLQVERNLPRYVKESG